MPISYPLIFSHRWASLIGLVAFLSACEAPGTPNIAAVDAPVAASFPGCHFVDPDRPPSAFITDFYLTTYGSAYSEGATAGALSTLPTASGFARPVRLVAPKPFRVGDAQLVPTGGRAPPFCMVLPSDPSRARSAANAARVALNRYGYSSSAINGGFQTIWHAGTHQNANWLDRYTITVAPADQGQSVAMVTRDIYIERLGPNTYVSDGDIFFEATSVGNNEAWILAYMRRQLP